VSQDASPDHQRLIRKLDVASNLTREDRTAIARLPLISRTFDKGEDLVRQGDSPKHACLVVEGVVCRHKYLSRGRRQILSIHVPGDMPDLQSLFLDVMDHGLATLTPGRAVFVPHGALRDLIRHSPNAGGALWRDTLIDASIFREGMAGLGRRTARERLAHLLCELAVRLRTLDLVGGPRFQLPLTQSDFADALGLTNVHVNRVFQDLRREGLVRTQGKLVQIEDWAALCVAGDFDADYLHLRAEAIPPDLQDGAPVRPTQGQGTRL